MKLIMIVGQAGSGKSKAGELLKRYGYVMLDSGDIIREKFLRENLKNESILSFAEHLFELEGRDLYVSKYVRNLYNQALSINEPKGAVIIGLRTPSQIMKMSEFFDEAYTIAIYASPEIRFSRIEMRLRNDDPRDFVEFLREDYRELAWGLDTILYQASYYIINQGSEEDLKTNLFKLPFIN